jgi:hypothetical protein
MTTPIAERVNYLGEITLQHHGTAAAGLRGFRPESNRAGIAVYAGRSLSL